MNKIIYKSVGELVREQQEAIDLMISIIKDTDDINELELYINTIGRLRNRLNDYVEERNFIIDELVSKAASIPTTDNDERQILISEIKRLSNNFIYTEKDLRCFLVNKNDNKIIIDFWEKFKYNDITENQTYLDIYRTNDNGHEVHTIIDYNGKTLIDECLYPPTTIGKNNEILVAVKYGYMILDTPVPLKDSEIYWTIPENYEIIGQNSIEYLDEYDVILVDDKLCYNTDYLYLGTKIRADIEDKEGELHLLVKTREGRGLIHNGCLNDDPVYVKQILEDN